MTASRTASFVVGLLIVGVPALIAIADQTWPEVPNDALTPGSIATSDAAVLCARDGPSYSRAHRVWRRQRETMDAYRIPSILRRQFQDDDRAPVCLGGDNADPRNHWAQPPDALTADGLGWEAKDRLDDEACREVCRGQITSREAQAWFLAPADWRVEYRRLFGAP